LGGLRERGRKNQNSLDESARLGHWPPMSLDNTSPVLSARQIFVKNIKPVGASGSKNRFIA
jgi:hypothetical protein